MSGVARHHAEWLNLIERSGPFLEPPVLLRMFPQGLPKMDSRKLGCLRAGYEEWAEAQESRAKDAATLHGAWIRLVLGELLEFDERVLRTDDRTPSELVVTLGEHREILRPSMTVAEPQGSPRHGAPRLLIGSWPLDQDLESVVPDAPWAASPLERMTQLCRSTKVRLGLVTNGKRWTLVDAPGGQTAGYASWYAGLWFQEPITLAAFEALLGVRRFFGVVQTDTLEAMLDESVAFQEEVTDQLGYQVRRAIEVLIQALDRADLDRQRELLRDVPPGRLYEAALTVMMRLVFLFCAEERGLLLLGDTTYDAYYAVSTLRAQLREEADRVGVEVLERRQDAWARLLATFRGVYGGIEHEALRLPALGGSLFDPDRFPFLEGRRTGSKWLETPASPLPIDNRTVLHLLDSLQLLHTRGAGGINEARKLSYRALDIEQMGHVYEGLLDHVVVRVDTDTLGLTGTKDKDPELSIKDLERERQGGKDRLIEYLQEHTGRSAAGLRNALDDAIDEATEQKLLVACGNDRGFLKRALPFQGLIRNDVWGYPQVYRAGSFIVTGGPERRQTGTHYTDKSLTEKIVTETLEPLVYVGPSVGKPREEWKLRSPPEILDLKICDMAMGSAAFLVQVCRWLGERLVEAWEEAERSRVSISAKGGVLEEAGGHDVLPSNRDERRSVAHRLIAERCVYGVDANPMAVELAKLSLWLVTLAKGRPFGFLDHNLRCGDSLLGVTSVDQLDNFHLDPDRGKELHRTLFDPRHQVRIAVSEALELRKHLRGIRIIDIEDVQAMARLDGAAKQALAQAQIVADALAAIAIASERGQAFDDRIVDLAHGINRWLGGSESESVHLKKRIRDLLDTDCPERLKPRRPFHWAIEFPEVFARDRGGFDAIVGNPPFMGGQKLTGTFGTSYREYLVSWPANGVRGSPDLVAYFFLRAYDLLREQGNFGLLAVNTISEGDTRQVGLERLVAADAVIFAAYPNEPWPGKAAVTTSRVHIHKGVWQGQRFMFGRSVPHISAFLSDREEWTPKGLKANEGAAFQGSIVLGMGFVVTKEEALAMIDHDCRNREVLFPYLNGDDLNSDAEQRPSRWVINFWDWSEEKARTYPEPYGIVSAKVRPEREHNKYSKSAREKWWLFERARPELYHAIERGHAFVDHPPDWQPTQDPHPTVLATARVSKYLNFSRTLAGAVFSDATVVFSHTDDSFTGVLMSVVHEVWARKMSSSLETRLRYAPTDCVETFAFPIDVSKLEFVCEIATELMQQRSKIMHGKGIGLTELYNLFHNSEERDHLLMGLRRLHERLDLAVIAAYGWNDISLDHDFRSTSWLVGTDRIRFTLTEEARQEVLTRLSSLNRERYREETQQGLHSSKVASRKKSTGSVRRANSRKVAVSVNLSFDE
jgi:hypothetical protein